MAAMGLGWMWRLGSVAGVPIQVHWSFALLLLWVALRGGPDPAGWWLDVAYGVVLMLGLFVCVTLHELGHSLVARWRGIAVRDITLLPIGGIARMELRPGQVWPVSELLIALAGPAVNVLLALALFPLVWWVSGASDDGAPALLRELGHVSPAGFVSSLWIGNLLLAGFNLLPIFPMDGGRVLRALLALRWAHDRATRLAVVVGQVLALILAGVGLVTGSLLLVVVALVLAFSAGRELTEERQVSRHRPATVADARHWPSQVVSPETPLTTVVDLFYRNGGSMLAVVKGNRLVGVVRPLRAGQEPRSMVGWTTVAEAMETDYPVAEEHESVRVVRERMHRLGWDVLPVTAGDHYRGLVTLEALRLDGE
jgi:Zn-dependent protease